MSDFYRGTIDRVFDAHGVPPPVILFDPVKSALGPGHFQLFARISDGKAVRPGGAIPRAAFRLDAYGSMADFMVVVERHEGAGLKAWKFVYSGVEVDFAQTESLDGQLVSCLSPSSATLMSEVWTHAAIGTGARVLTSHSSPRHMLQSEWALLSIPLLSQDRQGGPHVDGFVVYANASNRYAAGLDLVPDPIVIVDENGAVWMVNEAARRLFGNAALAGSDALSLADYTRSDLDLSNFRAAGPGGARRLRQPCRCLLNGMIVPMDASIAKMRHRNRDYMVLSLRPSG